MKMKISVGGSQFKLITGYLHLVVNEYLFFRFNGIKSTGIHSSCFRLDLGGSCQQQWCIWREAWWATYGLLSLVWAGSPGLLEPSPVL